MTPVRSGRARSILIALAVAVGGASSPAAAADADPAASVQALIDAVDDGRYDDIAGLVCSAQRDEAARRLDLTDVMRDVPASAQRSFRRLLDVSVNGLQTEVLEDDGQRALVRVAAVITASLDENALARGLRTVTWSGGIVDDPVRRSVLGQRIRERFAAVPSQALVDEEVEVVRERGAWSVCGDLGWGIEALDPSDVCSLLSPAELALLVAIPFVVRTSDGPGCTYSAADGSGELSSVNVRLDEGSLDLIHSTFADGVVTSVAGFDAYGAAGSLWVDLGGHLLAIQPTLIGAPEAGDPQQLAQAIAEIIVPRIDR